MAYYVSLIRSFVAALPRLIKYQIITKLILSFGVLPLFWLAATKLAEARGLVAVTNDVLFRFIFSAEGSIFLVLICALLLIASLVEVGGVIVLSFQSLQHERESAYHHVILFCLKRLPSLLGLGGVLLTVYFGLLAPLSQAGLVVSFLPDLEVPKFISSVIESNSVYYTLYLIVMGLVIAGTIPFIFTFHFLLLEQKKPIQAMKHSVRLIRQHWWVFLRNIVLVAGFHALVAIALFACWVWLISLSTEMFNFEQFGWRFLFMIVFLVQQLLLFSFSMLVIPFEVFHLTQLFLQLEGHPALQLPIKQQPSLFDLLLKRRRQLVLLVALAVTLFSLPLSFFFEEFFGYNGQIAVYAHRAGLPENSIPAVKKSIHQGADWLEIDVQRSKDGAIILLHDETFKRIAGVNKRANELTVAQMKRLSFPVATLDEVLAAAQGKIRVNIEIKEKTAPLAFVKDVLQLVDRYDMRNDVMITSLQLSLIEQVEQLDSSIETGYIYFMAFGHVAQLQADTLILEQGALAETLLEEIHDANKKAVVWTINDEANLRYVSEFEIDGIITDEVKMAQRVLHSNEKQTMNERIYRLLVDE